MNIGIYNEPAGAAVGGTEYCVAVLAESLSTGHTVEVIHHRPTLSQSLLADTFGVDLSGVKMRYVDYEAPGHFVGTGRRHRYEWLKAWHAHLSSPYDVFINFTHGMPPFCHARFGVLVVLFPMFDPFNVWPWIDPAPESSSALRKYARKVYYEWEWKRRLYSYRSRLAISEFTKKWTRKRWCLACQVLYPPVDTEFTVKKKENLILSVGRFAGVGVKKNQLELASVFRRMTERGLNDWKFASAGAVTSAETDIAYFKAVKSVLPPERSELLVNAERSAVRGLYERAKIFWHATGFDSDEQATPELMEHFGIVTVEAMSAGCVPVVIRRGGQGEIVEHGVSGFLWNTLDELESYTARLIADPDLCARMSAAARARSSRFDRKAFIGSFRTILSPALSQSAY